jgi:hypothetical protein
VGNIRKVNRCHDLKSVAYESFLLVLMGFDVVLSMIQRTSCILQSLHHRTVPLQGCFVARLNFTVLSFHCNDIGDMVGILCSAILLFERRKKKRTKKI